MNMHMKAETDIPRLKVRSITVELRSGDVVSLFWHRQRSMHEGKYLMGDYFRVYSDSPHLARHPDDLKGMKVLDVELDVKSPNGGQFEVRELTCGIRWRRKGMFYRTGRTISGYSGDRQEKILAHR